MIRGQKEVRKSHTTSHRHSFSLKQHIGVPAITANYIAGASNNPKGLRDTKIMGMFHCLGVENAAHFVTEPADRNYNKAIIYSITIYNTSS